MKKHNLLTAMVIVLPLMSLISPVAFALEESDVQSAIAASSKEEIAGNIFIWFLCAIGFLKVSQKIDSILSSLGVNAGRTGGSMMSELLIAGRAVRTAVSSFGGNVFSRNRGGSAYTSNRSSQNITGKANRAAGSGVASGHGLIGLTKRRIETAAVSGATGKSTGTIGEAMFASSLAKGGSLAAGVVSTVALGDIASVGTISGEQASKALTDYLGYETEQKSENESQPFDRITDVQEGTSPYTPSINPSVDSGASVITGKQHENPQAGQIQQSPAAPVVTEAGVYTPPAFDAKTQSSETSGRKSNRRTSSFPSGTAPVTVPPPTPDTASVPEKTSSHTNQISPSATKSTGSTPEAVNSTILAAPVPVKPSSGVDHKQEPASEKRVDTVTSSPDSKKEKGAISAVPPMSADGNVASVQSQSVPKSSGKSSEAGRSADHSAAQPKSDAGQHIVTEDGAHIPAAPDSAAFQAAPIPTDAPSIGGGTVHSMPASPLPQSSDVEASAAIPAYRSVEIGGGRITGYETMPGESEERQFAMYNTEQYMEPTGDYTVIKTVDGESWYKQYAEPVVKKTPREEAGGKISYDQKIVRQMPQIPKRKDRV